jgi:hypothetical protein
MLVRTSPEQDLPLPRMSQAFDSSASVAHVDTGLRGERMPIRRLLSRPQYLSAVWNSRAWFGPSS